MTKKAWHQHQGNEEEDACITTPRTTEQRDNQSFAKISSWEEVKEIENVLSETTQFSFFFYTYTYNNNHWQVIFGIVGIIDFLLYCLVSMPSHKNNTATLGTDDDAGTDRRRGIASLLFSSWQQSAEEGHVNIPTNIIFTASGLSSLAESCAVHMTTILYIAWIIEAGRRSYHSYALSINLSKSNSNSNSNWRSNHPFLWYIGTFTLSILLLPSIYWYPTALPLSEYPRIYSQIAISQLKRSCARLGRQITISAIRHPAHFKRRAATVLNVVRWLRYFVPIFASANKLLSHLRKCLVTYWQHRAAESARRVTHLLWGKRKRKSVNTRTSSDSDSGSDNDKTMVEEREAIRLQRNYRRWKAYQRVKIGLVLWKEDRAVALVQTVFRKKLKRIRANIHARTVELHDLQELKQGSEIDIHRKRELESELVEVLREKRKILILLRPTCLFCAIWKAVVMVFIGIDIVLQYQEKTLKNLNIHEKGREVYSNTTRMESYMITAFLPTPMGDTAVCQIRAPPRGILRVYHFLEQVLNPLIARRFNKNTTTSVPWYCNGALARIQALYITVGAFAINRALASVGAVLLLDVFVTFFTGEFAPSGILIPAPFIKRWILGFAVKLLLNPLSKPMAKAVLEFTMEVGLARLTWWYFSFIEPGYQFTVLHVWIRFVQFSKGS